MGKAIVVTANLGHLKVYRLQQDRGARSPRISLIQTKSTDFPTHLRDVVTDQAGRFRKGSVPAGPSNLSDGEDHNLDLERRRRALKALAQEIGRLVDSEGVNQWGFAAAEEMNAALLATLKPATRAKLRENVRGNLTRLGVKQLLSHFHELDFIGDTGKESRPATRAFRTLDRAHVRHKPSARRTNPLKK